MAENAYLLIAQYDFDQNNLTLCPYGKFRISKGIGEHIVLKNFKTAKIQLLHKH